ncbi:DNA topoisomerase III [Candidatus Epulonipiscium fishelsonii]|uniref:DNA topoisomerase III n=1 Tax=Candidatus Epulonipiscium fishelsonii TaxID=77094 RepID=A0ACC8X844_9FIRM|nr:DNA topoisomerase III [Epulopiscium sp. SCG-B11WGA-EpuloA1]ONI41128.1 DNA topoisomerase III [Epulopiscium sp. SCG-B05WGA-EpuloA1]
MKKLILAEKPSVAKNIADAFKIKGRKDGYFEGTEYVITWAFGHLIQLYDAKDYDETMKIWRFDKFPFIPSNFEYKIKTSSKNKELPDEGAIHQLNIIKELINREDIDSIVSATDYDREGQLIADELFLYFNVKKPIYRILINEWTEDAVKKGMSNLLPNSTLKSLQDAGMSRQWADWIIGINLTSVASLRYGNFKQMINIGRVLLPTLKIIYDRDKEIAEFKSVTYYKLIVKLKILEGNELEGIYYEQVDKDKYNEKFDNKAYLLQIQKDLSKAQIIAKEVEKKKEYPPLLFNLSNLQGHITSKYKTFTSDKVLKIAQTLYEKKYITYPRTASVALEETLINKTEKVLNALKIGLSYEPQIKFINTKRIFDNSKVESHSAIIPTYIKPKNLSPDEQIVYLAVKDRFIMQFLPIAEYEETKIISKPDGDIKGVFISKGKVELAKGWKIVEDISTKDTLLPNVNLNDILEITNSKVNKIDTKPPKLHTEKTLLKIMETCGKKYNNEDDAVKNILNGFSIGTPATRADTITKLKSTGYITTKSKNLTCTELGKMIVNNFPIKELMDLEYTGKLEKMLFDIEKQQFKKDEFLTNIIEFTKKSVELIKNDDVSPRMSVSSKNSLGKCPLCNSDVVESNKAFGCTNWRSGCKFTIWKDDWYIKSLGKEVTPMMVELLLNNGKVGFKNLKNYDGTSYSAYFSYVQNDTHAFKWQKKIIN